MQSTLEGWQSGFIKTAHKISFMKDQAMNKNNLAVEPFDMKTLPSAAQAWRFCLKKAGSSSTPICWKTRLTALRRMHESANAWVERMTKVELKCLED